MFLEGTGALVLDRAKRVAYVAISERANEQLVAESGSLGSGRAQLRALTLGGAVWDAFRENANCGDPGG